MKYLVTSVDKPIKIRTESVLIFTGKSLTRLISFSVLFRGILLFNFFVAMLWLGPPLGWVRRTFVFVSFVRSCRSGTNASDQHGCHLAAG